MSKSITQPAGDRQRSQHVLYNMRALGRDELPPTITVGGATYRHETTIKHDFWAVTGFYLSPTGERVVLKCGRVAEFCGFSLAWAGRYLCWREMHFYERLADLPNIPKVLGRVGKTGFVHEYVKGRPLSDRNPVPETYFDKLFQLIDELHRRGIAYVDTNKPQNILVGDDGEPHLIDFQISWDSEWWINKPLSRWIGRKLAREDRYHLLKHKRKIAPREMTEAEARRLEKKSVGIRMHRTLFKPYFGIRRRLFKRLRDSGRLMAEGSK
jgi:predicted Ser/Thr protein kinase